MLRNLTEAPNLDEMTYTSRFDHLTSCPSTYYNLVIHEITSDTIIGSAMLIVEHKFLRNAGKVGHIEDVAVSPQHGGRGFGIRLIKSLEALSRSLGCYKTILDCNKDNIGFYEKCGWVLTLSFDHCAIGNADALNVCSAQLSTERI